MKTITQDNIYVVLQFALYLQSCSDFTIVKSNTISSQGLCLTWDPHQIQKYLCRNNINSLEIFSHTLNTTATRGCSTQNISLVKNSKLIFSCMSHGQRKFPYLLCSHTQFFLSSLHSLQSHLAALLFIFFFSLQSALFFSFLLPTLTHIKLHLYVRLIT